MSNNAFDQNPCENENTEELEMDMPGFSWGELREDFLIRRGLGMLSNEEMELLERVREDLELDSEPESL